MDSQKEKNKTTPLLIYDGDCGFCVFWATYWQKLTGASVDYQPYQKVAKDYPSISVAEFQRAVQYVAPTGEVSSAAKASFLTLSHAKGKAFWFWLYKHFPGFALISEFVYAFIASHRSFFYDLSVFLWGRHYEPPRYQLISWLFLRGLGLIFLCAFVSFAVQDLGLIGKQGILPINEMINIIQQKIGLIRYWIFPMVFWLNSSDIFIHLVCWGGAVISLLLVFNIRPILSLILLYILYLSLIIAGQVFMSFQWDLFLLEAGVISIVLVGYTTMGIWLLRWLLFRFMLAGGLVKLISGDDAWWNLTALYYHFLTQPLPTPLAWYANQLPHWMLQFGAGATLFIEIILPFLIFLPRHLRFFAGFSFLLLQSLILITGNYNFFNLQTILLCIVLFDDAAIRKIIPERISRFIINKSTIPSPSKKFVRFSYVFAVITVILSIGQAEMRLGTMPSYPMLWLQDKFSSFRIVSTYGPFAVMTRQRMEIILEGSDDGQNWQEYTFRYKPGDINRRPLWNIPHQPRLDWQMWFAALGSVNENPWLINVMQRLLENSPAVIGLLETNPFPDKPPRYIHAQFYEYYFTDYNERNKTGAWWSRRYVGEYYPPASLN